MESTRWRNPCKQSITADQGMGRLLFKIIFQPRGTYAKPALIQMLPSTVLQKLIIINDLHRDGGQ
jgi:hypothetical protein